MALAAWPLDSTSRALRLKVPPPLLAILMVVPQLAAISTLDGQSPGQGALLIPSTNSATPAPVPDEVKAKPLSASGSACAALDTVRVSKLITVAALLADPTAWVRTADVLVVKFES